MPLPPVRNRVDISKHLEETKAQIAKKEALKKAPAKKAGADPNDIFTEKDLKEESKTTKTEVKYKRDITAMPDYYKAWDRFDIDKALDSDEEGTLKIKYKEPEPVKSQADMMRLTSGAKPNTKIVIKGGTQALNADAEHLKSQGNSYFQSLDYQNAIDSYTRCLTRLALDNADTEVSRDMRKIVLSNRA
jgi:hypothetical protein